MLAPHFVRGPLRCSVWCHAKRGGAPRMKPALSTPAFGPWRTLGSASPHPSIGACGGCRVTGAAHVPRAGSPPTRSVSSHSGPPPLLRCAGHPTSSARNHGCPREAATATVVPRALWWGAVWREVKEEGRNDPTRSEYSVNRPGGHGRHTAPRRSAPAQLFEGCTRRAAAGRKRNFASRSFHGSRMARSAIDH